MKRLRCFILAFFLAAAILMSYVSWRTYAGLTREEEAQLSYFAETLLTEMEKYLAELIMQEENRSVEEYRHTLTPEGLPPRPSPLSGLPSHSFILGYFQNNPDGSFQTPLVPDLQQVPADRRQLVDQLSEINREFNRKKYTVPGSTHAASAQTAGQHTSEEKKTRSELAERYLAPAPQAKSKTSMGQQEIRTQEITARQALNLAAEDHQGRAMEQQTADPPTSRADRGADGQTRGPAAAASPDKRVNGGFNDVAAAEGLFVELAPFQSVFITTQQVFFFRRVVIADQIYRQGFVVHIPALLVELATGHFKGQPLADFMGLRLQVLNLSQPGAAAQVFQIGNAMPDPHFSIQHRFAVPFDFLTATLQSETVPYSPARRPLNVALAMLAAVMLLGLAAIYHSARTVVDMSERRSQFVSSVTHELKTPLTNIRLYIEMLEQGIAADPQHEQEYLRVLDGESARLSRLINNVLELAKLEKKQRRFLYQAGDLSDVLAEVERAMSPKLKQEKFDLIVNTGQVPVFSYDKEVLVQLLINLIENSIKFGRQSDRRQIAIDAAPDNGYMHIWVSDTGPGIPRAALKKIFTDFYRVNNEATHAAGGTGIGLALVKKFVESMGGRVKAANNVGPGCTITLSLPIRTNQLSSCGTT